MIRKIARLSGLALLLLSGCGSILPTPAPPPALYHLTAARDFPPVGAAIATQLVVDSPNAVAALDSSRIALARSTTTLDYFADAAWTDRLTTMLQGLLIQSLENSHRLAAVAAQGGALRGDVVLAINLHHFEAIYNGSGPPHWRIELTAQLVKMPDRTLIAAHDFAGDAAAPQNDMPAIVDAADTAWRQVARALVDWVALTLAPPPRAH